MAELTYGRKEKEYISLFARACEAVRPGSGKVVARVFKEPSEGMLWAAGEILRSKPLAKSVAGLASKWKSRGAYPVIQPRYRRLLSKVALACEELDGMGLTAREAERRFHQDLRACLDDFFNSGEGVTWLSELVNPQSLSLYDINILHDLDYSSADAVLDKAFAVMSVSLLSNPADPNWPKLEPRTWLNIMDIEAEDAFEVGEKMLEMFIELGNGGEDSYPRIKRMINRSMARLIARERGFDRGRSQKALDEAVELGLVRKGHLFRDEYTGETQTEIRDDSFEDSLDEMYLRMLLQKLKSIINDPKDVATLDVIELYARNKSAIYTFEDAFRDKHAACSRVGLNTPAAVKKRLQRLVHKYPAIRQLNPSR